MRFGVLKVLGVDDRGSTVSQRRKYVFCTWIGANVAVMKRAKVSVQRVAAQNIFDVRSLAVLLLA